MEIVMKIPDYMYEDILDRYAHPNKGDGLNVLEYAIAKGTTLPKGHGDLIDRSEVEKLDDKLCNTECGCCALNGCFYDEARTIIEADKENEV